MNINHIQWAINWMNQRMRKGSIGERLSGRPAAMHSPHEEENI
jgi:hypothetical protein